LGDEPVSTYTISEKGLNGVGYFASRHTDCKPKIQSKDLEYFELTFKDGLLVCRCAKCDETVEEPLL
jgi:hypothetical protein